MDIVIAFGEDAGKDADGCGGGSAWQLIRSREGGTVHKVA